MTINADIVDWLRRSGLSRGQVRAGLHQRGYDPGLIDPYFDSVERGTRPPEQEPSETVLRALREFGYVPRDLPGDTLRLDPLHPDSPLADTTQRRRRPRDSSGPGGLPIFGRDLFRRPTNEFQPVRTGPVDPDYRIGPGDEIELILAGDVEALRTLTVNRRGYIVIPDVGQVFVDGLTMEQLEAELYSRLGEVYSSIRPEAGGTTSFQTSLSGLRSNQVFVIGEVERPGAYQVEGTATAFNALYLAQGPNADGSFRRIQVRRRGVVIREIDLYSYLLHGDPREDVRLEHGDVVFVPVVGPQVGVKGAVRRQAAFELNPGEGLPDVLRFAGGLQARALVSRVQIDRIVPPGERVFGRERVLVDVEVERLLAPGESPDRLVDGDIVEVFNISNERRNRLVVTGEVRHPGTYEWSPGMTLGDLIKRASGLEEDAYTPRAHIFRLNPEDGTRRLIRTPLFAETGEHPTRDVPLADRDSVVVYSTADLTNLALVTIDGLVQNPGVYPLAEGMTARDLILAAGGFIRGASREFVDIARVTDPAVRTDTTAHIFSVPVGDALAARNSDGGDAESVRRTGWVPNGEEFVLQPDDHVFVRRAAGYEEPRTVKITGQVLHPGSHVLNSRTDRLLDVLRRAGGMTSEGNPAGLQVIRDERIVATDFERALVQPGSRYNLVLEAGDSIHVPEFDPTVTIRGAVAFESKVLYEPGRALDYYINRSGGYTEMADRRRASVSYQNGERATAGGGLFFRRTPEVEPGSTIFIPSLSPDERQGLDWDQFLARTLSVVSTTITILIAVQSL